MSLPGPAKRTLHRVSAAVALGVSAILLTGCIAPALSPSVLDSGRDGLPEEGWHPELSDAQAENCRSCHKEGPEGTP